MTVLNQVDRFNLAIDVIDRVPRLQGVAAHAREQLKGKLIEHRRHVRTHGEDLPEIQHWQWNQARGPQVTTDDAERQAPEG
jgi:xylulose-5-phosphate/fructose-6-phosphate phosphoketolase